MGNRPPWARPEGEFIALCDRCGRCQTACAAGIVVAGSGGFPVVDFAKGSCTFCADCVRACPTGALSAAAAGEAPWRLAADFAESCLAARGVACRACGDWCEAGAIRFRLAVGGRAFPQLDAAACTGCGACVAPCPVGAVKVVSPALEGAAACA